MEAILFIGAIVAAFLPFLLLAYVVQKRIASKQARNSFPDVDNTYEGPPISGVH